MACRLSHHWPAEVAAAPWNRRRNPARSCRPSAAVNAPNNWPASTPDGTDGGRWVVDGAVVAGAVVAGAVVVGVVTVLGGPVTPPPPGTGEAGGGGEVEPAAVLEEVGRVAAAAVVVGGAPVVEATAANPEATTGSGRATPMTAPEQAVSSAAHRATPAGH